MFDTVFLNGCLNAFLFLSISNAAAAARSKITPAITATTMPEPEFSVFPLSRPPPFNVSGVAEGIGPGISTGPTSAGRLVGRGVAEGLVEAPGDVDGSGAAVLVGRIVLEGAVVALGVDAGRGVTRAVVFVFVFVFDFDVEPELVPMLDFGAAVAAGAVVGEEVVTLSPALTRNTPLLPCFFARWLTKAQSA